MGKANKHRTGKRPSLEEILDIARADGPRCVRDLGVKLNIDEAIELEKRLGLEGISVRAFDFPGTNYVWSSSDHSGIQYKHIAIKDLIKHLAKKTGADYKTVDGFKRLLPQLTEQTFIHEPINQWGTTIGSMLNVAYSYSPSAAILDLIKIDDDFLEIRKSNLQPYDFPAAPNSSWKDKDHNPTEMARQATKELVKQLSLKEGVDYKTVDGFKRLLPYFKQDTFDQEPINIWGTTLCGMLANAYKTSPSAALMDLINHDAEFIQIKNGNLQPYDFPAAPQSIWRGKDKKPTHIARQATKQLITLLAGATGADYKTIEGFSRILPEFTADTFRTRSINIWGTTLNSMLTCAYSNSPSAAVLDLVNTEEDFKKIMLCLQPYDFPKAPISSWRDKKGNPTDAARHATKQLIKYLAEKIGADYKTVEGFKKLIPSLRLETFINEPINIWGTKLGGMICAAYSESPSAAVLDLIKHDDDFRNLRRFVNKDVLAGNAATRIARSEGNYSAQTLRPRVGDDSIELSDLGFYSFSLGEKSIVRELLAEQARTQFGDKKISYFGLEGPTFGSYFSLAQKIQIDARSSLVPEMDRRNYTVMQRISRMRNVNKKLNRSSLYGIELKLCTAEDALQSTEKDFDLFFLDWLGFMSPSKVGELELAYKHMSPEGMIAATLNLNPISENRYQRMMGRNDSQTAFVHEWADSKNLSVQALEYAGGDKIKTTMCLYVLTSIK
jgi:hypothetical protein